jgi:hypothetical protein
LTQNESALEGVESRVARWYGYFQTKNPDLGISEGLAMRMVGKFYGHLVNFPAIWYILCSFGIFYPRFGTLLPILVCCTKKNLATLAESRSEREHFDYPTPLATFTTTLPNYEKTGSRVIPAKKHSKQNIQIFFLRKFR